MGVRVRVLAPDLKLLGASGKYLFPKVHDIVEIDGHGADLEIKVGNVEPAEDAHLTKKVAEQTPTRAAHLPTGKPDNGKDRAKLQPPRTISGEVREARKKLIIGGKKRVVVTRGT